MTDIATLIRQMAHDRGYSSAIGDAMAGIAFHESSHDPRNIGDGGTSYGLFQLHRNGGALGSMSDAQARRYLDPRLNTTFALDHLKGIVNNRMTTAQAVDAISRRFERPANPSGEIAHALEWLRGNQTSTPLSGQPSLGGALPAGGGAGGSPMDSAMTGAITGAKANATLLHLPFIKLPDIGGQIPFRATVDQNVNPTSVPAPSELGSAITAAAKHFLGIKYTWGGTTPQGGFDCSGIVQYVFRKFGISTPRVSEDQFKGGQGVSQSQARPGDLIFFRHASGDVGHVGIFLGNGQFLHAPHTGDVVKISNLAGYGLPVAGFRRYAR
jgi:cell wall-associated NlpC family hydrolase